MATNQFSTADAPPSPPDHAPAPVVTMDVPDGFPTLVVEEAAREVSKGCSEFGGDDDRSGLEDLSFMRRMDDLLPPEGPGAVRQASDGSDFSSDSGSGSVGNSAAPGTPQIPAWRAMDPRNAPPEPRRPSVVAREAQVQAQAQAIKDQVMMKVKRHEQLRVDHYVQLYEGKKLVWSQLEQLVRKGTEDSESSLQYVTLRVASLRAFSASVRASVTNINPTELKKKSSRMSFDRARKLGAEVNRSNHSASGSKGDDKTAAAPIVPPPEPSDTLKVMSGIDQAMCTKVDEICETLETSAMGMLSRMVKDVAEQAQATSAESKEVLRTMQGIEGNTQEAFSVLEAALLHGVLAGDKDSEAAPDAWSCYMNYHVACVQQEQAWDRLGVVMARACERMKAIEVMRCTVTRAALKEICEQQYAPWMGGDSLEHLRVSLEQMALTTDDIDNEILSKVADFKKEIRHDWSSTQTVPPERLDPPPKCTLSVSSAVMARRKEGFVKKWVNCLAVMTIDQHLLIFDETKETPLPLSTSPNDAFALLRPVLDPSRRFGSKKDYQAVMLTPSLVIDLAGGSAEPYSGGTKEKHDRQCEVREVRQSKGLKGLGGTRRISMRARDGRIMQVR
ncbi:unnamed protein product [Chrysoparadoxa australica]